MANAAPPVGPQGAVSGSVARSPQRSPLSYSASAFVSASVAVEPEPAAPLISLSDVTPSTADILLITLNNDHQSSSGSITQLDTTQNLVITSIGNENFGQTTTALLLSPPSESVSLSSSDDVFLAPPPKVARLTELRNVRHAQKTYAKPPQATQLILSPDDVHVPVSQIVPATQVKPNDNSLLKALISRPCMKIPSANIMRSIQIPIIRPIAQQGTLRAPSRRPAKSSGRTAPVRATLAHTSQQVPVSMTTLNTETITSFAVTSAMTLFSDSAPISSYLTTASLITIPITTLSYATTKTYAQCAQKARVSTPMLIPLTTSTVTSLATNKSPAKTTSIAAVVASAMRSFTTATVTSLTTNVTNVRLISTDNYMTTVARDTDSHTRVTYATKVRNPPSIAVQSPAATAVVTGTTSTAIKTPCSTAISSSDTQFLEPLPVTKSRTSPAARTFSGPRKVAVKPRPSGNIPQRVVIRHANPQPQASAKMPETPASLPNTADAAVTHLPKVSQIIHKDAPPPGPLPTPTSTISFATSSSGTTHTLIVPHYKDTVFKNLSSITCADPTRIGNPRCQTEKIVIRRPVAYFSPRRSFSCVGSSVLNPPSQNAAQRTIIRAVPVSLADNPQQRVLRTEFINLPQGVLTTATVPDNILAETTSLLTLTTPTTVTTTS